MNRTQVLIISHDVVDTCMAGPGVRYWELARVLALHCQVVLAVPGSSALRSEGFELHSYRPGDWESLRAVAEPADAIMPCGFVVHHFPQLLQLGRPLVMDLYDPYPAETLTRWAAQPVEEQTALQQVLVEQLRVECLSGDFFLCASERQRDWWLGMLAAHGRLNPATYRSDPTLRNLIDVVPFGCRSEPLQHTHQVLKGVIPGIAGDDPVLLWGGGIWDWLDPLTLLYALPQVLARRPNVRLVFPGTRHPNQLVPAMTMGHQAIALARELGLLDTHVFFGDWIPYADWPNYLWEADIGVSLHFDSLETRLAFRSRVLDYVWAGLPMVVSRGDVAGELVRQYGLGIVVDYQDVEGVAEALLTLLDEPRHARAERFAMLRQELTWERVAQPLIRFCSAPYHAADRQAGIALIPTERENRAAAQVSRLEKEREEQQMEIARLQELIQAYEQGRFIRFMRFLDQWRRKLSL